MMYRRLAYLVILFCIGPTVHAQNNPNIIFILADDLGITDINAFATHFTGADKDDLFYETPHLDRLVAEGIAFSQSYANQLCTPTRAAILTGRIASRMGVTTATGSAKTYFNQALPVPVGSQPHDAWGHRDPIDAPQAWVNGHTNTALDPNVPSLPQVLATHHAAFLGKWHLGGHGVPSRQPSAHGFEELNFFDAGASKYFNWHDDWNRTQPIYDTMPNGECRVGYSSARSRFSYLTDDLSFRATQFIRQRAAMGESAKPFLLYYCPFAVHTPLQAPAETVAAFENKKQKGFLGHNNATYAAMLKHLDDSIGEIRATLEATGLADNTLIVFSSDNGGVEYTEPVATDNQPFLGGKACLYEGGIRVPTIFYWPAYFEGGQWCDAIFDATDFLPTLAEMTNNPFPEDLDGLSALPLLNDPKISGPDRTLYWHYPFNVIVKHPRYGTPLTPHSAIRHGDYKLIWDWQGRLELYNIAEDPYEKDDLAHKNPALAKTLHEQLKSWLRLNVASVYWPTLNPAFDANAPGTAFKFHDLR
ncbi:sulfatase [Coraliomargarita sp. SDUM461004]|uniref:Sulfatase n=1 Tax=Thalassobacterium sedimentorum TaxID=3041258 RepID=A0ABU1AMU7_9BACT|nr:sulfatase [Coraliomargarita sp. SDUM461004]MDQ8196112.1 sulfatase [Coraliomargarita sp. SDUM461004]